MAAAASGEAALCVSGGSASLEDLYDDITITVDKSVLPKDFAQKKFTFAARANVGGSPVAIPAGSGEGQVKYTFGVTYHGETVPQTYGGKDYYETGTDSVTLLDVPAGSYTICVTALYGGKAYGGEFVVKIFDATVAQGTEGTALADFMLDPSVTEIELYIENDYKVITPSFPDEEKVSSGYYRLNNKNETQKYYSCIVPAGKTLSLKAEYPVSINCDSVYRFFNVSGTLVIGQNVTITGQGLHHNEINIQSGGKVILDGGKITNGTGGGTSYSAITVENGGMFIMRSGLMSGNNNTGAVKVEDGGRFEMQDGEISGNVSRFSDNSGGVTVNGVGIFIKSGGTIKNNTKNGSQSQMMISANGKYGPSESELTTYDSPTEFTDAF